MTVGTLNKPTQNARNFAYIWHTDFSWNKVVHVDIIGPTYGTRSETVWEPLILRDRGLLSKYLIIMELHFDATLYPKLGNENFDAGHIKC